MDILDCPYSQNASGRGLASFINGGFYQAYRDTCRETSGQKTENPREKIVLPWLLAQLASKQSLKRLGQKLPSGQFLKSFLRKRYSEQKIHNDFDLNQEELAKVTCFVARFYTRDLELWPMAEKPLKISS